jgi:hypothetical protein
VRERDRWAGRLRWASGLIGRLREKRKEGEKSGGPVELGGPAEGKQATGIIEMKKRKVRWRGKVGLSWAKRRELEMGRREERKGKRGREGEA